MFSICPYGFFFLFFSSSLFFWIEYFYDSFDLICCLISYINPWYFSGYFRVYIIYLYLSKFALKEYYNTSYIV